MGRKPLGKWISIIYRHSLMYANSFLKESNINGGQLPFFMQIVESPGITQDELTKILKIDKSTTAKSVKALEKNGYVIRKKYEVDKRSYKLFPTQKALELRDFVLKKAFDWDDKVLLSDFDEKERRKAYKILERIANNVINYFKKESG